MRTKTLKSRGLSTAPPPSTPTSSLLMRSSASPPTAFQLFKQEVGAEVNTEVNEMRKEANITHLEHPGMYQTALKTKWEGTNQDQYRSQADKLAKNGQETIYEYVHQPHFLLVYAHIHHRNQQRFREEMRQLLSSLIGHGPGQLGFASFHLCFAFRGEDEKLQRGTYVVPSCILPTLIPDDRIDYGLPTIS